MNEKTAELFNQINIELIDRISKKQKFMKDNGFDAKGLDKNIVINATKGYCVRIDGLNEQDAILLINKYILKK